MAFKVEELALGERRWWGGDVLECDFRSAPTHSEKRCILVCRLYLLERHSMVHSSCDGITFSLHAHVAALDLADSIPRPPSPARPL